MRKILLLLLCCLYIIPSVAQQPDGVMYNLAKTKSGYRSKRISSYDKEGYNADRIVGIKPGEKVTICDIEGSGIINHIWFTIAPPPDLVSRNDIILRMYWDGNDYPSVESPIGPFFGQGWDESYLFSSFALSAGPAGGTGLSSYFTMPFSKGARIEIENQADNTVDNIFFYVDYWEVDKLPEGLGRFHAWYNREVTKPVRDPETGGEVANTDGKENYVFADIQGKGHFVGINYFVHSPSTAWYGEGDDMWFIDGEKTPSMVGTGTEDFFNTSWCPKEPFQSPFFGYPRVNNETGWLGRTHVYRFFINDPVFFDKSLKATIEHGTSNDMMLDIATVAYWYQDKASHIPAIPGKEGRKLMPFNNFWNIHMWREAWKKANGDPDSWGNE